MRREFIDFIDDEIQTVAKAEGAFIHTQKHINDIASKIQELQHMSSDVWPKCSDILNLVSENTRKTILPVIENLMSKMLSDIFQVKYVFRLELTTKNNRPYIIPTINEYVNNTWRRTAPEYHGDGMGNLLDAGLKIILRILLRDKIKGPMIFDETFPNLDKNISRNVFMFLSEISKKFDFQIILVTHDPNATDADVLDSIDRLIKIDKIDGVSKVEVIK